MIYSLKNTLILLHNLFFIHFFMLFLKVELNLIILSNNSFSQLSARYLLEFRLVTKSTIIKNGRWISELEIYLQEDQRSKKEVMNKVNCQVEW